MHLIPTILVLMFNSTGSHSQIVSQASMTSFFTENLGQWEDDVLFFTQAGELDCWLTSNGVVYRFARSDNPFIESSPLAFSFTEKTDEEFFVTVLNAQFIGASQETEPVGAGRQAHYTNYYIGGDPESWRTHVPSYDRVIYPDLYPGIDLEYRFEGGNLKYDIVVEPGADPSTVAIRYEGVSSVEISPTGLLHIVTANGILTEGQPVAWQERGGFREYVAVSYCMIGDNTFGYFIPVFDSDLPLIIDPPLELVYGSYLGGNQREVGTSISIGPFGAIVVAGETRSSDFPLQNPYQGTYAENRDAFVTVLSSDGSELLYSTYLGGGGVDNISGIHVDSTGSMFLAGYTSSSDFPLQNPYQSYQGGGDAFVAKLSPAGDQLVYSTCLGGAQNDHGFAIVINASGSAIVTGDTASPDFPLMNPFQTEFAGGERDAFVTCLTPEGDDLIYSTFLGGGYPDEGYGIDIDDAGCIYVAGRTASVDFPVCNAFQEANAGSTDAFIVKMSASGSEMEYGTYLGGWEWDNGWDVVAYEGCAFIAGATMSNDFPTQNPFQAGYAGGPNGDAFLTKLDPAGNQLVFSTFFGGTGSDGFRTLETDNEGSAFLSGYTHSQDLPLMNPFQNTYGGGGDMLAARFTPLGDSIYYSTYLGGASDDAGRCIYVDGAGNAFIAGTTFSTDFPLMNPFQPALSGSSDVCIIAFGPEGTGISESGSTTQFWSLQPNPFRDNLFISISINSPQYLELSVFDCSGRRVDEIQEGEVGSGVHEYSWIPGERPSGVYFVRLTLSSGICRNYKVLLLK